MMSTSAFRADADDADDGRFLGHYHLTCIRELSDGMRVVHRRSRPGAPQFDPRGISSEEPVLRLLRANGLPVPEVHDFRSVTDHELVYIPGVDLFPWTAPDAELPPEVLKQLAGAWVAQMRVSTKKVEASVINAIPATRRYLPTTSQDFHATLVEWLISLHRVHQSSINPLLRSVGFVIGGDRDGGQLGDGTAIWEPFRADSKNVEHRPLSLIHGDLSPKNLIFDGRRLSIIDWELAGVGDPAWDLAVFIQRSNLTAQDCKTLFEHVSAEGPEFIGIEEDVRRYQALELFKSIIVDSVRFQALVAEDPGRIPGATEDLASRLDHLLRFWRDVTADRETIREFLLAKVVERRTRSERPPRVEQEEGMTLSELVRRDTCGLDLNRGVVDGDEARRMLGVGTTTT